MKRARARFYGRVQGVFFRANTREKARELRLTGWVKNMPDGSVEAVFEGDEKKICEIINFCTHEISGAVVRDKKIEWEKPKGVLEFEIKYRY